MRRDVAPVAYWGLRDYGTATWLGGDEGCDHVADASKTKKFGNAAFNENRPSREATKTEGYYFDKLCGKCGAVRQDSQLGLEPTPEEYVANMVAVFREVRRVLRADGTCWVNLGDSYNNRSVARKSSHQGGLGFESEDLSKSWASLTQEGRTRLSLNGGAYSLKEKDLVGIPWRVAFALQADGWYLRSDIIWSKPNPMPESVTDRPTKAHEYLFLLSKSARYYYDNDGVREPHTAPERNGKRNTGWDFGDYNAGNSEHVLDYNPAGRNLRSVWSIATQPYPGAHFATFPEALVEPCVKAGTSGRGVCPECGAPWRRVVERELVPRATIGRTPRFEETGARPHPGQRRTGNGSDIMGHYEVSTTGWQSSCGHTMGAQETGGERDASASVDRPQPAMTPLSPLPATVLDPFAGSGTTGRVAQRLGRRAVLIDLNGEYLTQTMKRNADIPLGLETA